MPYQRIPRALRPAYLKNAPVNPAKRHTAHIDAIRGFENSNWELKNVTKLDLVFKAHNAYGHQGAKLFWKHNLKTLQYHNPSLPITVQRIQCDTKEDQLACPAVLRITLADGTTKSVDCKNAFHGDIMNELLALVEAEKVQL